MTASPNDAPRRLTAVPDLVPEHPGEPGDPAPRPHATAEEVEAARHDTKLAQVLYHDWEAETYDDKWSISYDERCIDYAKGRFDAVAGDQPLPYRRALELGCGTGFFLLNLMQGGVAQTGSVTDLSPGMVQVALRNAQNLKLPVDGRVADAETIPYDDETFDLVVGHAVLHHIPDVEQALRECLRVLEPGGRFVFAGEPTNVGNFYARWLGRATWAATTNVTRLPFLSDWRRPQAELDESSRAAALEAVVDLHTFDPGAARADRAAGGCGGGEGTYRGVRGGAVGMAGAHLRSRGTRAEAHLPLPHGDVPGVAGVELDRRSRAAPCGAALDVLQRDDHRSEAPLSSTWGSPSTPGTSRFCAPTRAGRRCGRPASSP